MYSIHDEEKILELFKENKIPKFRYEQIKNAIYKNNIKDFSLIETIPKDLRFFLKENFFYSSLKIKEKKISSNKQTIKMLFETTQKEYIEGVIMRHLTGRNTLCVSCQIGCPMGCSFCATGKLGLNRNLDFSEIIDQIMHAINILYEMGEKLRNVVYMGMGEPFLNYENVKKSIEILCEQKKVNLANRRITVSTCGIIDKIDTFGNDFPQMSLAISLHAPNDKVRSSIMPVNKKHNIKKLIESLDNYVSKTNKRIFYEYIMLSGINDNVKLAYELGELLKGKLAHVNFIPYNPGDENDKYKPTPRFIIEKFQKVLNEYGIPSTIRATLGDDINAACGQLANKE